MPVENIVCTHVYRIREHGAKTFLLTNSDYGYSEVQASCVFSLLSVIVLIYENILVYSFWICNLLFIVVWSYMFNLQKVMAYLLNTYADNEVRIIQSSIFLT